jgi:hypothetical protein
VLTVPLGTLLYIALAHYADYVDTVRQKGAFDLMQRFRTFLAGSLLLVFAWSRVAEAMPLVLCLGSDGHKVIELASSEGCHNASKTDLYVDSGYTVSLIGSSAGKHGDCNDIALPDEVRSPVKVSKTLAPPAPVFSTLEAPVEHYMPWALRMPPPQPVATQLAQLRTVVLRL